MHTLFIARIISCLFQLRMKEYIHRKEKGQLLVHHIQKHMNGALQEVRHSTRMRMHTCMRKDRDMLDGI
jgi:hypothetical protein